MRRLAIHSSMTVLGPLVGTILATTAHAQWNISMRAMQNPLPVGQCTAIEVVVKDPNGYAPLRPNGSQLDWQDFELTFTAASPDAFAWSNEKHRFLCARAPTAASATVIAHYPGSQLKPNQIVAGVSVTQSVEVAMQGVQAPPTTAAVSDMPTSPPGYGPPGNASPGPGAATGYGPGVSSPGQGAPQNGVYAADPGSYPGQQGGVYGPAGAVPVQPAPYGAATDPNLTGTGPTVAGQPQMATNSKQFIQKVTTHAKLKAREVAAHAVDATADATNEVVDTTLEAGSQVVRSNMQSTAGSVGEAGKALVTGGGDPGETKDVAGDLAKGRVVLRSLRFQAHTAMLDPSTGPLIAQLAQAMLANPGQFLIEGHVDKAEGEQAQALSEQRAAAVKAALVSAGVSQMQLAAAGYGATRPLGAGSVRIEIARTQ
jgi:outer membrane protein OmpA-like peptidoglycan-associated protein